MPEGDTIHKLAAALKPALKNQIIFRSLLKDCGDDTLAGARVTNVEALGKHLFINFDTGVSLRSHLGMYGSWHRYEVGEPWRKPKRQASIALWTNSQVFVCFHARDVQVLKERGVQRAGTASWPGSSRRSPRRHENITSRTGDPGRRTPLIDVLLDQRVACGIGNVYKSELLFLQEQAPLKQLGDTSDETLEQLYRRAAELLLRNTGTGPRTTRPGHTNGARLWVYGRGSRPCLVCGETIKMRTMGKDSRSTYWCPRCQNTGDS